GEIIGLAIGSAKLGRLAGALDQVGPGDAQSAGNGAHWVSSSGLLHDSKGEVRFFGRERSRASLRISASIVFLPSMRSRSRTRFSSSRTWEAPTTTSSA